MRKLLISALLLLPAAAYSQELTGAELDAMPGLADQKEAAAGEPVQRPEAERIMSELSSALRLSSKQEERIGAAVKKEAGAFDKLMREYEKNSAEEKKWRFKTNEARYGMVKINRGIPDVIREFLDDEQREAYDAMLEPKKKPAAASVSAPEGASPRPARKKKVLKRKKAPAPAAAPEAAEEEGGVMVDGDAPRPAPRKKILKRKPAAKPAPAPAPEEPAAEEEAAPASKEAAPEEEDAAAYP